MGHNVLDTLPFPRGYTAGGGTTYASPAGDGSRVSPMAPGLMDTANSPFYDNDQTSNSKFRADLAGRIFSVIDTVCGTLQPMLLRAVQLNCTATVTNNVAASSGTPGNVALMVQSSTGASYKMGMGTALQMGGPTAQAAHGRFGVVAMAGGSVANLPAGQTAAGTNLAPVAGAPAKPLDCAYQAGKILVCGDIVYVVEEGPCLVPCTGTATPGKEAMANNDGSFSDVASDADVAVGTWSACNATAAAVTVGSFTLQPYQGLLMVKRGYQDDRTGS